MEDCKHLRKKVVWTHLTRAGETINGPRQLRQQCTNCGELFARALPHSEARNDTPNIDEQSFVAWLRAYENYWQRYRMSAHKRESVVPEIVNEYQQYLLSDQWKVKRSIVLNRCNHTCEGCGSRRATQVHHLTYLHLGDEFLWELKAVCDECHRRCHPEKHLQRFENA